MKFEWYLALRYFRGKRKGSSFLSFIKIMAIGGVAIGSAGLLIALSIVHGFKSTIDNKVLGFAPHITISTYAQEPIYRSDTLRTYLQKYPEIASIQAVVTGEAMIQSPQGVTGTFFKGVDAAGDLTDLKQYIAKGQYQLREDSTGLPGIIIGSAMAQHLQATIGDKMTAYTVDGIPSPLDSPDIQQFRLTGIYKTGIDRFDDVLALVDRTYAKQLFGMPGDFASAMDIQLKNNGAIKDLDASLASSLPFPYFSESIYDRYYGIFQWVDLQEATIPFVISVMIIVAAFNLIGTILMMVLERTRDIGILKTIGAPAKAIRSVFLFEGVFVGALGLAIGTGAAVLFNWLQATYQLIPLSEENYYMSYAPVEPHALDFAIVAVVSLVLCALASWLPARIASKTEPLDIIAYGR